MFGTKRGEMQEGQCKENKSFTKRRSPQKTHFNMRPVAAFEFARWGI